MSGFPVRSRRLRFVLSSSNKRQVQEAQGKRLDEHANNHQYATLASNAKLWSSLPSAYTGKFVKEDEVN